MSGVLGLFKRGASQAAVAAPETFKASDFADMEAPPKALRHEVLAWIAEVVARGAGRNPIPIGKLPREVFDDVERDISSQDAEVLFAKFFSRHGQEKLLAAVHRAITAAN